MLFVLTLEVRMLRLVVRPGPPTAEAELIAGKGYLQEAVEG
jgi:hypothetical protein